jgi:NAD(P)-dependent dehydrogenase (short-subunit alcohol dehydrogenase family)
MGTSVVLITGGLTGIGRAVAVAFAKGVLRNNLVTFSGASCSELLCSSIPHESHEETY